MISIVTGTLDRLHLLPNLIKNTILSNDNLELILVDGGSTDGTIEYLNSLDYPNLTLIEVGGRSPYSHYMNLGIMNSKYDYICQWNDDVILVNKWDEVINELDDSDFYLFNWKDGSNNQISSQYWLEGNTHANGWFLCDDSANNGEIVMNYGIYHKKIFREIGLYNPDYKYYCCDGDMSYRAHKFGYKHKTLRDIKVCTLPEPKKAIMEFEDIQKYEMYRKMYDSKQLPNNLEYLKC